VVITVFIISLLECLFVLPAHLSHQREWRPGGVMGWIVRGQRRFGDAFTKFVENVYGPFVGRVVRSRYTTISICLALLIVTAGYVASGRMGMALFPSVESDYAFVTATLPYGVAESKTEGVQQRLVEAARRVVDRNGGENLSTGIYSEINENIVTVRTFLTPPEVRPLSTSALTDIWRTEVGEIPGLESLNFESDRGGPGSGKNLTVELTHRNIAVLDAAGQDLADDLSFFPMVKDIDDGSARGKKQYDFQMRPEGERMGFRARDVARQVRDSFFGAEALKLQRGRNEVTVTVRLPKEERVSEYALEDLVVRAPDGTEALLRDVVTMESGRAYTTIARRQARRTVSVTANVLPRSEANRVIETIKAGILPELQARYPGLTYSFEGRQADMQESIASLIAGLFLSLICIFALLAVPFRSFVQPLIIMICVPFGFVGVVGGHLVMGYSLSVMSLFGMVALSGVVVNGSLVLIHTANARRLEGLTPIEAIRDAGIQRFRPIILTTLTTFGGLGPMIFETSRQARFMIPMAISLGFGVLFATIITLILVPALYMAVEDARNLVRKESEAAETPETLIPVYGQMDEPTPEHRGRLI
jgi:multidrug efflux pump subunit AcrB